MEVVYKHWKGANLKDGEASYSTGMGDGGAKGPFPPKHAFFMMAAPPSWAKFEWVALQPGTQDHNTIQAAPTPQKWALGLCLNPGLHITLPLALLQWLPFSIASNLGYFNALSRLSAASSCLICYRAVGAHLQLAQDASLHCSHLFSLMQPNTEWEKLPQISVKPPHYPPSKPSSKLSFAVALTKKLDNSRVAGVLRPLPIKLTYIVSFTCTPLPAYNHKLSYRILGYKPLWAGPVSLFCISTSPFKVEF